MNQEFISVHLTITAVNRLLGTNLSVRIEFTDGINAVSPDSAKYAEALVTA